MPPSPHPVVIPASLSHFVIFNPSLGASSQSRGSRGTSESRSLDDPGRGVAAAEDAGGTVVGSEAGGSQEQVVAEDEREGESVTKGFGDTAIGAQAPRDQAMDQASSSDTTPPTFTQTEPQRPSETDRDLEDDLLQASQILFYTSREAGGVSRDRMLRQVGLVKGLMSFSDMAIGDATRSTGNGEGEGESESSVEAAGARKDEERTDDDQRGSGTAEAENGKEEKKTLRLEKTDNPSFWSIHSHRSRLLVYTPEPDIFIYVCITLAHEVPVVGTTAATATATTAGGGGGGGGGGSGLGSGVTGKSKGEPAPSAQGLGDHILIHALQRGYEDFCLLHSPLSIAPPSPSLSTTLDKFWTRFAFSFENTYLTSSEGLLSTWLGGYPSRPASERVRGLVLSLVEEQGLKGSIGLVGKDGPIYLDDTSHDGVSVGGGATDPALVRYLVNLVRASLPLPAPPVPAIKADGRGTLGLGSKARRRDKEDSAGRKTSWATTLGSAAVGWVPGLGSPASSRSGTPAPTKDGKDGQDGKEKEKGEEGKSVPIVNPGTGPAQPSASGSTSPSSGKTKWPLGLGGLGGLQLGGLGGLANPLGGGLGAISHGLDAMNLGSVGAVLGIASPSPKHADRERMEQAVEVQVAEGEERAEGGGEGEETRGGEPAEAVEAAREAVEQRGETTLADGKEGKGEDVNQEVEEAGTEANVEVVATTEVASNDAVKVLEPTPPIDLKTGQDTDPSTTSVAPPLVSHGQVEQTPVAIPDLEEAVTVDVPFDLGWESRGVWVKDREGGYAKRRLVWVMRDHTILSILLQEDTQPPFPTPSATSVLALFSALPSALGTGPLSSVPAESGIAGIANTGSSSTAGLAASAGLGSEKPMTAGAGLLNSSVYHRSVNSGLGTTAGPEVGVGVTESRGPEMDKGAEKTLLDLREYMCRHPSVSEVHARTAQSQFVVAKRSVTVETAMNEVKSEAKDGMAMGEGKEPTGESKSEVYMVLGRKEATLTDSDHALRAFAQSHPELA